MGLTLETFLNSFQDMLFIIEDEDGKIIYPSDRSIIDYIKQLKKVRDNRYFNPNYKLWYKYDSFKINGGKFTARRFIDITNDVLKENFYDLDNVTGILLRRKLLEDIKAYLEYTKSNGEPFTICLGDLDKFKLVNDTYGHLAGDEVLRNVAQKIYQSTRHTDIIPGEVLVDRRKDKEQKKDVVGRYGGEEFLFLIKNIDADTSFKRIEEIREFIANNPVFYRYPNDDTEVNIPITISFGIVHISADMIKKLLNQESNLDTLSTSIIKSADDNLYEAKKLRNRTVLTSRK